MTYPHCLCNISHADTPSISKQLTNWAGLCKWALGDGAWWTVTIYFLLHPLMPLPSHIVPPATTAPANISPIKLIYLISVFMPFNYFLYSQIPELLLEVEVVKWRVFCPRSLFGLIDDAFSLIQSTLNGWCGVRRRNTSSFGHVKGYNYMHITVHRYVVFLPAE